MRISNVAWESRVGTTFAETCRARGVETLTVFGDSITVGEGASSPEQAWARRLADTIGCRLDNKGISGTVLQSTPLADGRGGSGASRFRRDLLEGRRGDALAILYGYNDARYVADPARFNVTSFVEDYRRMLDGLLDVMPRDAIAIGSPPCPSDKGLGHGGPGFIGQTRAGFEAYCHAVRELAAEYGVFYAAVYEAMAANIGGALASPDITHPNDQGHAAIAQAFATARLIDSPR